MPGSGIGEEPAGQPATGLVLSPKGGAIPTSRAESKGRNPSFPRLKSQMVAPKYLLLPKRESRMSQGNRKTQFPILIQRPESQTPPL